MGSGSHHVAARTADQEPLQEYRGWGMVFSRPDWVPESGSPYPGAEHAAEMIGRDQEAARLAELVQHEKWRELARRQARAELDSAPLPDLDSRVDQLIGEMLSSSDLAGIPDQEPVIEGLLYRATVARMNGRPGSMKSFVAIDMSACVGTGRQWNGMPVTLGPVLYLVAEGLRGIPKRVRAWEQTHQCEMRNVHFLPRPVQVAGAEWMVFQEACRRICPVLVVVDTQARSTVGIEESSNEKMGPIFERIERLARISDACVLLVHHTGHTGDHGRGASSMLGAVQTEISVKREGHGADKCIVIKGEKSKDDDDEYAIRLLPRVVEVAGMHKRSGAPETSIVLVPERQEIFGIPGLTPEVSAAVQRLDKLGAPTDLGRPAMRKWLMERQVTISASNTAIGQALKFRRDRAEKISALESGPVPEQPELS